MQITAKMLKEHRACREAIDWLNEQGTTDAIELVELAKSAGRFDWINWLGTRLMTKNSVLNMPYSLRSWCYTSTRSKYHMMIARAER